MPSPPIGNAHVAVCTHTTVHAHLLSLQMFMHMFTHGSLLEATEPGVAAAPLIWTCPEDSDDFTITSPRSTLSEPHGPTPPFRWRIDWVSGRERFFSFGVTTHGSACLIYVLFVGFSCLWDFDFHHLALLCSWFFSLFCVYSIKARLLLR